VRCPSPALKINCDDFCRDDIRLNHRVIQNLAADFLAGSATCVFSAAKLARDF